MRLLDEFDGFCLHTNSKTLKEVLNFFGTAEGLRVMAWVKPFAAFKRNVSVAYAWEPVIVKAARKPVVKPGMTYRDFISEPITLKRGLSNPSLPGFSALGHGLFSRHFVMAALIAMTFPTASNVAAICSGESCKAISARFRTEAVTDAGPGNWREKRAHGLRRGFKSHAAR